MSIYSYEQDVALLEEVLQAAGHIALSYFKQNVKNWLKEDASPVSDADMAVNEFLEKNLRQARPSYGWISEESESELYEADDDKPLRYFIVDPIDGTRGFLANDLHWCISVAIAEAGEIVAAAIVCPALGEAYNSVKGGAAFYNGAEFSPINNSNIIIAAPYKLQAKIRNHLNKSIIFHEHVASLAYSVILCARGLVDCVVIRPSCKEWDVAAANLILANRGGVLYTHLGEAIDYSSAKCYNGYLFACKNRQQFSSLALEINKIIG